MRSSGQGSILEAFKPGTAPPDSYNAGGAAGGAPAVNTPGSDGQVGSGTGGLY